MLLLVEALGGISPPARAHIGKLARRSEGKGAADRTKYGGTRISATKFYVHHSQMLSKAAVVHDAKAIRKRGSHASSRRSARPRKRLTTACVRKPSVAVRVGEGASGSPLVLVCTLVVGPGWVRARGVTGCGV